MPNVRKTSRNMFFLEYEFYSKSSPRHVGPNCDNPVKTFEPKNRKIFRPMSDTYWKIGKKLLLKKFHWKFSIKFSKSQKKHFKKRATISSFNVGNSKNLLFLKKTDFLGKLLWTCKKQYWKPWRKRLAKSSKGFCSRSEKRLKNLKFFREKMFFLKVVTWHVKCSFKTFARKIPMKGRRIPLKVRYW